MRKRKSVKHFHGPGHLHELTFTCYAGQPLLSIEGAYSKLAESIQKADDTLLDWPWSSARYYLGDPSHEQQPGMPLISSLGYS